MQRFKVEGLNIDHLKPVMKTYEDIGEIPVTKAVISAKADGEFTYIHFDRNGETYCANRWESKTTDFAALNELVEILTKVGIQKAEFLAEFYGMENGRPVTLPNFIHFLKNGDPSLREKLFLGIFDIISVDGINWNHAPWDAGFSNKLEKAQHWGLSGIRSGKHVHILPWMPVGDQRDIQSFWDHWVEELGYEGIVIRNDFGIFKLKPILELDAVIIGINKQNKGFKEQTARSVKLALMNENGSFVEIGDVSSGITVDLGKKLWKLTEYKVGEDNESVLVKPLVIINVKFNATYPKTRNRVFTFEPFRETGQQTLIRMRHPKFIKFRTDKTPCIQDIGLNQVPLENGCA